MCVCVCGGGLPGGGTYRPQLAVEVLVTSGRTPGVERLFLGNRILGKSRCGPEERTEEVSSVGAPTRNYF